MSTCSALENYDPAFVPNEGLGLYNTGAICHENSLLQALVSCSAVLRAAFAHRDYLAQTGTGRAFYDFVFAAAPHARPPASRPFFNPRPYEESSACVLEAVVVDLRRRRPSVQYGPSQESASEGLAHLLDMMDAPGGEENPIARLFYHRYCAEVFCSNCGEYVSESADVAVHFNLFAYDLEDPSPSAFGDLIRCHKSSLENYRCGGCAKEADFRRYKLRLVPEVVVCLFNLYDDGCRARAARPFPSRILFPGLGGAKLRFRQVAQIEHSGCREGGHYFARALRGDGQVYRFDDLSVTPSAFGPTPNVYMVFYHHCSGAAITHQK